MNYSTAEIRDFPNQATKKEAVRTPLILSKMYLSPTSGVDCAISFSMASFCAMIMASRLESAPPPTSPPPSLEGLFVVVDPVVESAAAAVDEDDILILFRGLSFAFPDQFRKFQILKLYVLYFGR